MTREELMFERPRALDATAPPESRGVERDAVRLLVTTSHGHARATFRDLAQFLDPGTVVVVNRSATLPASLPATAHIGAFTLNLSTQYSAALWLAEPRWSAAVPGPLPLAAGDEFTAGDVPGRLVAQFPGLPRLWFVHFAGDIRAAMRRHGSAIRYAYLEPPFPSLDAYQTLFGVVPGSAEMPSAARPFTPRAVNELHARGCRVVSILLHTGVASLEVESDDVTEQVLYPEPFEVDAETARVINSARAERRPIIAVGTSVVRALESAWDGNRVQPSAGFTRLFLHPARPTRVVDGLITGFHDALATHLALLYAMADPMLITDAYATAISEGYLWHEFGDSHLIMPRAA